jgi:hypothetical protein
MFGSYVNGIEQFEINPKTKEVRSVWANSHVSCTSSIPVVSEDDILYCLGKRPATVKGGLEKYTIEAVDWKSGKSLFFVELSHSLLSNSLYAATEIGVNKDIVMGTLGGLLRVGEATTVNDIGLQLKNFQKSNYAIPPNVLQQWSYLDLLAEYNMKGEIPSKEFLEKIQFMNLNSHKRVQH